MGKLAGRRIAPAQSNEAPRFAAYAIYPCPAVPDQQSESGYVHPASSRFAISRISSPVNSQPTVQNTASSSPSVKVCAAVAFGRPWSDGAPGNSM